MAYGGFKDLLKATASDKFLHDKAVNIEKNSKYIIPTISKRIKETNH